MCLSREVCHPHAQIKPQTVSTSLIVRMHVSDACGLKAMRRRRTQFRFGCIKSDTGLACASIHADQLQDRPMLLDLSPGIYP